MNPDIKKLVAAIRTRLSSRGVKGVTGQTIEETILSVNAEGYLNESEKNRVVEILTNKMSVADAGGEATVKQLNSDEPTPASIPEYKPAPLATRQATQLVKQELGKVGLEVEPTRVKSIAGQIVEQSLTMLEAVSFIANIVKQYDDKQTENFDTEVSAIASSVYGHLTSNMVKRADTANALIAGLNESLRANTEDLKSSTEQLKRYWSEQFGI